MKEKTKNWLRAAGIRAGKTFAQTALSMLTIGQAMMEVNWLNVLSVAGVSAVISILTIISLLQEVPEMVSKE